MMDLQKYQEAKAAYYAGTPIMTDSEFDSLELILARTNPEILNFIGSSERSGKEKLPHPMGSLNQIYNQKEFDRWSSGYPKTVKFICTEKLDGNSAQINYHSGLMVSSFSRGDGIMGANNTRHTKFIPSIPKSLTAPITGHVRGELIVSKKNWPKVKEIAKANGRDYANARNFVAGFMNATTSNPEIYQYIDFVAFDFISDIEFRNKEETLIWLKDQGFKTPSWSEIKGKNYDTLQKMVSDTLGTSEYELDGIVIDIDDKNYRDSTVDLDNLNPSHARKIKSPSKSVSTTVTAIEWQVSKNGLLKPVVIFEPVQLTGVTISRASGYNAKNVVVNSMGVGAIVKITRQGDVIPRVDSVTVPAKVDIPAGAVWDDNGVELIAPLTDENNTMIIQSQLESFFGNMEIDFIGSGNVAKLLSNGITSPVLAIKNMDKFEEFLGENGRKATKSMQIALSNSTPEKLFSAMGLFGRGMGERKLKALFDAIPMDMVLSGNITESDICLIPGFETNSAKKILENCFSANSTYSEIKDLVVFTVKEKVTATSDKFTGEIICATGVRLSSEMIMKIELQGGTVTETFNKLVTLLVAKDASSNSGKAAKAKSMGIKIVSLNSLLEMIG